MEQRIGTNIPPVHAAGTDPAYVPGLTFARPVDMQKRVQESQAEQPSGDAVPEDEAAAAGLQPEELDGPEEGEDGQPAEPPVDGPVFEVSDRRGSITADHAGVMFRLDGEEAEFPWDEIGAVEIDLPRFGRRFAVNVYTTSPHRKYETDVEAPARGLLKQWTTELDAVLDAYFNDTEH